MKKRFETRPGFNGNGSRGLPLDPHGQFGTDVRALPAQLGDSGLVHSYLLGEGGLRHAGVGEVLAKLGHDARYNAGWA